MSYYTSDLLEAQAEAVTINELGSSNHSFKNSKTTSAYNTFINSFIYACENITDININTIHNMISNYIQSP